MKIKLLALLALLLVIAGCNPGNSTPAEDGTVEPVSECDSISDPSRKIRCMAWELKDISLCDTIPSARFKEDCVIGAAQLSEDESQLDDCMIAQGVNNQIMCQALVKRDVNVCFTIKDRADTASDLSMRDCIDLIAQKMQDKSICDSFTTHMQDILSACGGATSDCEGRWIDGAAENAEHCKENTG